MVPVLEERRSNLKPENRIKYLSQSFIPVNPWGLRIYYFIILAAVEFVMAFSWFGFIKIEPVSITTLHIPVLLGAIFFGRWMGTAVAGVFGVISMWKATYMSPTLVDAVFSPFISGDPMGSVVVGFVTRIAFGFIAGFLFEKVKTLKPLGVYLCAVTIFATFLHSMMVLGAIQCFFPQAGVTIYSSITLLAQLNGVISWGLALLIVPTFYLFCKTTYVGKQFTRAVSRSNEVFLSGRYFKHLIIFFVVFAVIMYSLVMHLVGRIQMLFTVSNFSLDNRFSQIIFDEGLQFTAGIAAVIFLLFFVFAYFFNRTDNAIQLAQCDPLTKVLNREAVAQQIDTLIRSPRLYGKGLFIIIDIDHFKEINDTMGHPYGDSVLVRVAHILQGAVRSTDIIGYLGGDEFCLYLPGEMEANIEKQRVEELFKTKAHIYLLDKSELSWSFGIVRCKPEHDFDTLYREADDALYVSKYDGRNCYHYYNRD